MVVVCCQFPGDEDVEEDRDASGIIKRMHRKHNASDLPASSLSHETLAAERSHRLVFGDKGLKFKKWQWRNEFCRQSIRRGSDEWRGLGV
jgi:hypothetical protein